MLDRYKVVYKEENEKEQIEMQMKYELGMSSEDMYDEISILKYLWMHKLIKFGETNNDANNDAIDVNGHLKDNDFKYIIMSDSAGFKFINQSEEKNRTLSLLFLEELSSGERIYFNLLLWDLIHKININLIKLDADGNPSHGGLVTNGANLNPNLNFF